MTNNSHWIHFMYNNEPRSVNFTTMEIYWQSNVLENIQLLSERWCGDGGFRHNSFAPFTPEIQEVLNGLYADHVLLNSCLERSDVKIKANRG